jgi:hypothetical protein
MACRAPPLCGPAPPIRMNCANTPVNIQFLWSASIPDGARPDRDQRRIAPGRVTGHYRRGGHGYSRDRITHYIDADPVVATTRTPCQAAARPESSRYQPAPSGRRLKGGSSRGRMFHHTLRR